METINKKMIYFAVMAVIGGLLILTSSAHYAGSTMTGMGSGLVIASVLKILQFARIKKSPDMLAAFETRQTDERNLFIASRARSATFACSVMLGFIAMVAMLFLDLEDAAFIVAMVICGEVLMYAIFYRWYEKRC